MRINSRSPLPSGILTPKDESRMLSAIATLERDGDESIGSLLTRFMR
jgi:hypothetical protein